MQVILASRVVLVFERLSCQLESDASLCLPAADVFDLCGSAILHWTRREQFLDEFRIRRLRTKQKCSRDPDRKQRTPSRESTVWH